MNRHDYNARMREVERRVARELWPTAAMLVGAIVLAVLLAMGWV